MPVSLSSVVVAAPNQLSCDLGGEVAILNTESAKYYGLNAVGARIWELIQKPTRVAEVRDALVEEYDVAAERCQAELLGMLEALAAAGLIEVHAETVP